jgi:hypothetical protein
LKNLYLNPNNNSVPKPEGGFEQFSGNTYSDEEVQQHFDEFYEEVYTEVEEKVSSLFLSSYSFVLISNYSRIFL